MSRIRPDEIYWGHSQASAQLSCGIDSTIRVAYGRETGIKQTAASIVIRVAASNCHQCDLTYLACCVSFTRPFHLLEGFKYLREDEIDSSARWPSAI